MSETIKTLKEILIVILSWCLQHQNVYFNVELISSFKKVRFEPYNWLNRKSNGGHFLLIFIFYHGLWWYKPLFRSISIIPVKRTESKPVSILSVRYKKLVSFEWFLQNLDWFYKEFCYLLDPPWFNCELFSLQFLRI